MTFMRLSILSISFAWALRGQAPPKLSACEIHGPRDESVTFPVERCHTECVKATDWNGVSVSTTEKQFSLLFDVSLDAGLCICSIKSKQIVRFRPIPAPGQAQLCKNNTDSAKAACWKVYKRGRATDIEVHATRADGSKLLIAQYKPYKYSEARFRMNQACRKCTHDECSESRIPSVLDGLSDEVKAEMSKVVKAMAVHKQVDTGLKDFAFLLGDPDRDELEFEENSDDADMFDVDELRKLHANFTKDQFDRLLHQVGVTDDGKLRRDQFHKFQDVARDHVDDFECERLDLNGNNKLEFDELYEAYKHQVNKTQLTYLISIVNGPGNGDGSISCSDFAKFKDTMHELNATQSWPEDGEDQSDMDNDEEFLESTDVDNKGEGQPDIDNDEESLEPTDVDYKGEGQPEIDNDEESLEPTDVDYKGEGQPDIDSDEEPLEPIDGDDKGESEPGIDNDEESLETAPESTSEPTHTPTQEPTPNPTAAPTHKPTPEPTSIPTAEPTLEPTPAPTAKPTQEPTPEPTAVPTPDPTSEPTAEPTEEATWQVVVKCMKGGKSVDQSLCTGAKSEALKKIGCEPQDDRVVSEDGSLNPETV